MEAPGMPQAQGLYEPQREHDACGVGFIVHLKGKRSHQIVMDGLTALANLEHRGASGSEVNTGDGAGLLIQIPDAFFRHELAGRGSTSSAGVWCPPTRTPRMSVPRRAPSSPRCSRRSSGAMRS